MTGLEGSGPGARVVVVEADPALRARLARALQAQGFDAIQVGDLPALLGRLDPPEGEHASFAVAWRPAGARVAPTATPLEVLAEARLLLLTASTGGPLPEHVTPAVERVERLRARAAAARDGASPRFDELVGVSPPMVELVGLLGQVAASDVSVLITGETGTGKERIARALHAHGPRARRPFVAISCAAMPEALLESELFGHVRGAFTGATAHEGLLVAASGGTLFLDEVGDAPLGIQRKLLRVLQERCVRPVGSGAEVPFDVRVIAATHRDLKAASARGEFREDLYFRLAVVSVEVPPLRARGEDVLLLAQEMLEEHHAAGRTVVRGLTDAAAERLLRHPWPGNVRELRNCIDRAVALARHPWLTVADLPVGLRTPSTGAAPDGAGALLSLAELELTHMRRVLHAVGGNKTLAARILGCDRRTLYRKLGADAGPDAPESH